MAGVQLKRSPEDSVTALVVHLHLCISPISRIPIRLWSYNSLHLSSDKKILLRADAPHWFAGYTN